MNLVERLRNPMMCCEEDVDAAADRIEALEAENERLKAEPEAIGDGFKTWWELALHVGAWKDHDLDYVHFGSEMAIRAFAIHLLKQRDEYEKQLEDQLAASEKQAIKATAANINLNEQLASAQAENLKLRAALDIAHAHADSLGDSPEEMNIVNDARLSTTSDTTALTEYRNGVIEECAAKCENPFLLNRDSKGTAKNLAEAIRALIKKDK